jgi:hypothetical protein
MAEYKIGLQKIDWLIIEADSFQEAITKAKEKIAYYESTDPNAYDFIGGHRIPEDYE